MAKVGIVSAIVLLAASLECLVYWGVRRVLRGSEWRQTISTVTLLIVATALLIVVFAMSDTYWPDNDWVLAVTALPVLGSAFGLAFIAPIISALRRVCCRFS
jgi:hypothetical protein